MKVCFIGHRTIEKTDELIRWIKETILGLIHKGAETFLFGSMSAFDELSWQIVTELKEEYPFIQRVYVRATYPHIEKDYEEYLLQFYERTYFPAQLESAGRYAYVERNRVMIDNSDYCVFYYNENYVPQENRRTNRKSGTKIAYEYAKKKKKQIINVYRQMLV